MKFFTRYYFIALVLSVSVFLETIAYTYLQEDGAKYYYSSSIIYFLAGLAICILPLIPANNSGYQSTKLSNSLPYMFCLFFLGFFIYHIIVLIPLYQKWRIDKEIADMLPTIQLACKRLLHGQTVYSPAPEIWSDKSIIPYLPMMWIPFLPAEIWGFDPRWVTFAALVISLLVITISTLIWGKGLPVLPAIICSISLFLLLNFLLVKNQGFWSEVEEPVVAAFYLLLGFALLRNNYWLIGIFICCCLLSRLSLVFWIPVYFGYVFIACRKSDFFKLLISFSLPVLLLFVIPFFIPNPAYFFKIPTSYDISSWFWINNHIDKGMYYTVGLYKFFKSSQLSLMLTLEIVTSITTPIIFLYGVNRWLKPTPQNMAYAGFGSLKISLLFFYAFLQVPFTYLFFVPTLLSYGVLFNFLSKAPPASQSFMNYLKSLVEIGRKNAALITILITAIFLLVYYSHQIVEANQLNYGQWGDGYKNYYTLSYYLKYDSGSHFTGMNYPYGENLVFTDNQPIMAWMLKFISKIFPSILLYIHAFLTYSIFLSVVISSYFIYKILSEFNVGKIHAAIFGSLIALLSPQVPRLMGHFALGYSCFLPILIFLIIRLYKTNGSFKIFFLLVSALIFFVFIHIYYVAMGAFFLLLIAFLLAISGIKYLRKNARLITLLILSALTPFLVLKSYLWLTDPVTDRPHSPWGFVSSRSTLADILLHQDSFTGEVAGKLFPKAHIVYHFEGMGYIGLVAIVSLFAVLMVSLFSFSKIKKVEGYYLLNIFIIAGFLVLLFAMAFPFSIDGLEPYYTYLPATIKQFRASGRFNWVFYYSATIYATVFISHLLCNLRLKKSYILYTILLLAVYSIWFIEMNMISVRYARDFKSASNESDEEVESNQLQRSMQKAGTKVENFQAILCLPFFLNGSEKLYIESGSAFEAMKTSLFTGLPLADTKMSRTSESQAFSIANLLGSDYLKKDVIRKFINSKPLLLLTVDNDFNPEELKLINRAHFLFTQGPNKYYELPLSAFADSTATLKRNFVDNGSKLISHGEYRSYDTDDNVVVKRFENMPKEYAIFGKGALYLEHGEVNFYNDTLHEARDSTAYEASIWTYADDRRPAFPVTYLMQYDTSGKEIEKLETNPKFSTNTFGKWVRGQIDFTLRNKKNKILMMANDFYGSYDEVMIRPKGTNVVTGIENDTTFMYNNFPIR